MTLKEYKDKLKVSYRQLANIIGLDHRVLYLYCQGKRRPTIDTAEFIQEKTKGAVRLEDWLKEKNGTSKNK